MASVKKKSQAYFYTKIKDLKEPAACINIYGILWDIDKDFTNTSSGTEHAIIGLLDDTTPSGQLLRVHFFFKESIDLPERGSIIRIHRLKIEAWGNTVDGRVFRSTDVVIFPKHPCGGKQFITSAKSIHYTEWDKARVTQLREFALLKKIGPEALVDVPNSTPHLSSGKSPECKALASKVLKRHSKLNQCYVLNPFSQTNKNQNPFNHERKVRSKRSKLANNSHSQVSENDTPSFLKNCFNEVLTPKLTIKRDMTCENIQLSSPKEDCNGNAFEGDNVKHEPFASSAQKTTPIECRSLHHTKNTDELNVLSAVPRKNENMPLIDTDVTEKNKWKESAILEDAALHSQSCGEEDVWIKPSKPSFKDENRSRIYKSQTVVVPLLRKKTVLSADCQEYPTSTNHSKNSENEPRQKTVDASSVVIPSNKQMANVELPKLSSIVGSSSSSHCSSGHRSLLNDMIVDIHSCSTISLTGSFSSGECPGIKCAGSDCASVEPVLLPADDPRLTNYDEILYEEMEIDKPDPSSKSEIKWNRFDTYLPFRENYRVHSITLQSLLNYSWPVHQIKVKVVKMKPCLEELQSRGPKNLVSGYCPNCMAHHRYNKLKWNLSTNSTKRPLCPHCLANRRMQNVILDFRMKLLVEDAWGTQAEVMATKRNAAAFLGVNLRDYQKNANCRKSVADNLSRLISSLSYHKIQIMRVMTQADIQYHLHQTYLQNILKTLE